MRFYYYAVPLSDGQWQLTSSLEPNTSTHASRELALLFARQQCRRRWEDERTPCGVRVQVNDGEYVDDATFGPELAKEAE
jgi:hypothetical protein